MSKSLGHTNFSMSNHLTPAMENMMASEHPASIPVYNALRTLADKDRYNVCNPTETSIAEKIHRNPRTVSRALKYMDNKGIIRICKINHTRYFILNTLAFFTYITIKESKGIAQRMQFSSPAEICRKDNPKFFKEYDKFLAKSRARRKSSKLSSYGVIRAYAKQHHTLPKPQVLSSDELKLMRDYLKFVVKSLCRSKLYMIVGNYLVDKLPISGKTLDIKNNDVSNALRGKVGKTTVFKAISYFSSNKFLLHLRGQMAISQRLLSNAKRSMSIKIKAKKAKIKSLESKLHKTKIAYRNDKKAGEKPSLNLNRH